MARSGPKLRRAGPLDDDLFEIEPRDLQDADGLAASGGLGGSDDLGLDVRGVDRFAGGLAGREQAIGRRIAAPGVGRVRGLQRRLLLELLQQDPLAAGVHETGTGQLVDEEPHDDQAEDAEHPSDRAGSGAFHGARPGDGRQPRNLDGAFGGGARRGVRAWHQRRLDEAEALLAHRNGDLGAVERVIGADQVHHGANRPEFRPDRIDLPKDGRGGDVDVAGADQVRKSIEADVDLADLGGEDIR